MNDKELLQEKKYLESTKSVIRELIQDKDIEIANHKQSIVTEKKHLWQNLSEFSETEMYSTMRESDLKVDIINEAILKQARLYRALITPYFGKIVFNGQDIYVGITNISKDFDSYVYDWRAPVSNMYYNYGVGPAEYETPVGTEKGEISLKRQFQIEMGELKRYLDTDVTIDDEILQNVLMSNSDEKMRNIVSTIQKEQNEVIRYKGKSNLVIEGVAGSGKTSVALHRIAYLLYNQKNLTSDNVLIFSPNEVFSNYISNVLPELGENNVKTVTLKDYAKYFVGKVEVDSISDLIKKHYTKENADREKIIKFKLSSKYKKLLDDYLKEYFESLTFKKKIGLKKTMLLSDELNALLKETKSKFSIYERIWVLSEKICEIFDVSAIENAPKMNGVIRKMLGITEDAKEIYMDFLNSSLYREKTNDTKKYDLKNLDYEDIFGILYLYFEICGYPVESHIKHVVIDEAQDYTMQELKFLKKIFSSAVFTILGDRNQVINPYHKYESLEEITSLFRDCKYIELTNTYRSSAEIIDYSNSILGLNHIKSIRKQTGLDVIEKVENSLKEDITLDIERFKELGFKRIAIITKNEEESHKLYSLLEDLDVGLISDSILKRIVIVPSYLSKGLEFDAVISYNEPTNSYNKEEKYLFYVVTTRAQHALVVYNNDVTKL